MRDLLFIVVELFEVEVVLNKFFNGQSLFFQVHHPIHIKHELAHRSNQSQYLLLQLFDQKQLEHCVGLEVRKTRD